MRSYLCSLLAQLRVHHHSTNKRCASRFHYLASPQQIFILPLFSRDPPFTLFAAPASHSCKGLLQIHLFHSGPFVLPPAALGNWSAIATSFIIIIIIIRIHNGQHSTSSTVFTKHITPLYGSFRHLNKPPSLFASVQHTANLY